MKRATLLLAALALLLGGVGRAKAGLITSLPGGTAVPMPNVNYEGSGPQTLAPGITWSSTFPVSPYGWTAGYGFGNNGAWDASIGPMAGLNTQLGSMTFAFATPQLAVGGFINYVPNHNGVTTATIAVYNSSHGLIESYNVTFNVPGGSSAIDQGEFLGFQEATTDISYFTLTNDSIGLTDLTVATSLSAPSSTPEPATLALLGVGIAGLAGYGLRWRTLPLMA